MRRYIHQQADWPAFRWNPDPIAKSLALVRHRQGYLIGRMQSLGFPLREEAVLATLTADVIKSSEIEGEILDGAQVRSSLARRLGMEVAALPAIDRNVEGVVEMMLDATQNFDRPLTMERLFGWHASLFPLGRSGLNRITVGGWREPKSDPMQVISGAYGRERVHFEAPSAQHVPAEMAAFLKWIEADDSIDAVLKAALAHLWFVTIHPFEDGNGRIARAIADLCLARSEGSPERFYSMSAQIRVERKAYYDMLETTQKSDLDVTAWLIWFLDCLDRAITGAETVLQNVLRKAEFWRGREGVPLNPRQRDIVNRLLDGFVGKLTSSKYALIEKCSPDTALRDINELIALGVMRKDEGGGRSTSYSLGQLSQPNVTARSRNTPITPR